MAGILEDALGCAIDVRRRDTRGWAMRRGHCKRLRCEKGRESTRGRAAFARSVNRSTRFRSWDEKCARTSLRTLRCDIRDSIEVVYFDRSASSRWEEEEYGMQCEHDCNECEIGMKGLVVPTTYSEPLHESLADSDFGDACSTTTASSYERVRCDDFPSPLSRSQPLLVRARSDPSTKLEYAEATSRALSCYLPLRAWTRTNLMAVKLVESSRRAPSRWELAVARAEQTAIWYCSAMKARVVAKRKHFGKVLQHDSVQVAFNALRMSFMNEHHRVLRTNLSNCFAETVEFSKAEMSSSAAETFMQAHRELGQGARLRPVYHGTSVDNYASIFERGLLIPGAGNNLRVVNGSAYGLGIYTAVVNRPHLSRAYARTSQLLVCGYLEVEGVDDSIARYAGDAIVIFDPRRVIPLFVAKGSGRPLPPPPPARPFPTQVDPTRSHSSSKRQRQLRVKQVLTGLRAHYARRAARKRRS